MFEVLDWFTRVDRLVICVCLVSGGLAAASLQASSGELLLRGVALALGWVLQPTWLGLLLEAAMGRERKGEG